MSTAIKVLIGALVFISVICCVGGFFMFRWGSNFIEENQEGVLNSGDALVEQTFTLYDPQFILSQMNPDAEQSHEEVEQIVMDTQANLGNLVALESSVLPPAPYQQGGFLILYLAECEFENGSADIELTYTRADFNAPLQIDRLRVTTTSLGEGGEAVPTEEESAAPTEPDGI